MAAATALAVAGLAASVGGSIMGANAANKAARAQQDAANAWMAESRQRAGQALNAYDQYAPQQQAEIDKSIQAQERNVQRQEQLVSTINPALIDAGQQMKQLLDGQSAPVLKNLQDQRNVAKQQMLDTLRQQLGPGAETSSLGQNMLQKFDMETSSLMNQAQQAYLDKVSNLAIGGGQSLTATMDQANKTLSSLGSDLGQIGLNRANIINGGTASMAGAENATVNAAGGQYKGQQLLGQGLGQLGQAGIMAGAYMAGGQAGKPGTATPPGTPEVAGSPGLSNMPGVGTLGGLSNNPDDNAGLFMPRGMDAPTPVGTYAKGGTGLPSTFSGAGPALGGYQMATGGGFSNYLPLGPGGSAGGINMPQYATMPLRNYSNVAGDYGN